MRSIFGPPARRKCHATNAAMDRKQLTEARGSRRGLLRFAIAFPPWLRTHNRQISRRAGPAWGIRQELVSGEHGEAVTKSTGVSRSAGTSITAQVFRTPGSYSIRPMESLKADCSCALQRKRPRSLAFACGGTFSPVRFGGQSCGIAAISSIFRGMQPIFSATQTAWGRERDSKS